MLTRSAGRLETALSGHSAHPSVLEDVDLAREVGALRVDAAPSPEFVAAFRERLRGEVVAAQPATRPRRLVLGRRLQLAGAAVGVAAVALAVVLVASRTALPGQPLYAVRTAVEQAGVGMARDDRARGTTLLRQAERHIADATTLAGSSASPGAIATALDGSTRTTRDGSAALFYDFAAVRDPGSLVVLRTSAEGLYPQVDALTDTVPADLRAQVLALLDTLTDLRERALTSLAACDSCGSDRDEARAVLSPGESASTPPSGPVAATPALPSPATSSAALSSAPPASSASGGRPSASPNVPPPAQPSPATTGTASPSLPLPTAPTLTTTNPVAPPTLPRTSVSPPLPSLGPSCPLLGCG